MIRITVILFIRNYSIRHSTSTSSVSLDKVAFDTIWNDGEILGKRNTFYNLHSKLLLLKCECLNSLKY